MIDDPELEQAFDLLISNAESEQALIARYRERQALIARQLIQEAHPGALKNALLTVLAVVNQSDSVAKRQETLSILRATIIREILAHGATTVD